MCYLKSGEVVDFGSVCLEEDGSLSCVGIALAASHVACQHPQGVSRGIGQARSQR